MDDRYDPAPGAALTANPIPGQPDLRDYQADLLEKIRDGFGRKKLRRIVLQSPTGSGKTVLFAYMTKGAVVRGRQVLILVHRRELIDQVSATLKSFGVAHGIICSDYSGDEVPAVQVASVQTLTRRLVRYVGRFDFIVIDETHHAIAETWTRVLAAFPEAQWLGVTATPERLDGKGLGNLFQHLIVGPTVADLTARGFLSPAVCFGPPVPPDLTAVETVLGDYNQAQLARAMATPQIVGNAVEHYRRLGQGMPGIAFCVSIEHSQSVAAAFADAGFRAAHVDGETPHDERRDRIAALGAGGIDVLCNCGLISEGLDVPVVGVAILLRPTKSLALHLQMMGRVLRPYPGKERTVILDHAGNTLKHGLPTDERSWSLENRERRGDGEPPVKQCPECGAILPLATRICPECGFEFPIEEGVEVVPGELVEVQQRTLEEQIRCWPYPQALAWAKTEEQLEMVCKARGYRRRWVQLVIEERGQR